MAIILIALVLGWTGRFLAAGSIIVANILVHFLASIGVERVPTAFGIREVSYIRMELSLDGQALAGFEPIALVQMLGHMFVHADIFHLLGNLIVLLAFALPFEERIGNRAFIVLYLLSGVGAAFAQAATGWGEPGRMLGASGAVFGIIGAFAAAYPRLVLPLPLPLFIIMIFVRMRVMVAAIVFSVVQVVSQYLSSYNPGDNTAYAAHIGGLAAGLVLSFTYVRTIRERGEGPADAALDLAALERFAVDARGREALAHMRTARQEHDVFEVWLERFLDAARSPDSGAPLALRRGHLVSTRGERFDVRAK